MASPRLSFHCATEARLTVTRWLAKNVITHTHKHTWKEQQKRKKCASPDSDPDRDPDAVKPSSGYLLLPLRIAKSPPKRETFPGLQSTVHGPQSRPGPKPRAWQWWKWRSKNKEVRLLWQMRHEQLSDRETATDRPAPNCICICCFGCICNFTASVSVRVCVWTKHN